MTEVKKGIVQEVQVERVFKGGFTSRGIVLVNDNEFHNVVGKSLTEVDAQIPMGVVPGAEIEYSETPSTNKKTGKTYMNMVDIKVLKAPVPGVAIPKPAAQSSGYNSPERVKVDADRLEFDKANSEKIRRGECLAISGEMQKLCEYKNDAELTNSVLARAKAFYAWVGANDEEKKA